MATGATNVKAYSSCGNHFHPVDNVEVSTVVQAVATQYAKTVTEPSQDQFYGKVVPDVELDGDRFSIYLQRPGIDAAPTPIVDNQNPLIGTVYIMRAGPQPTMTAITMIGGNRAAILSMLMGVSRGNPPGTN